MPEKQTLNRKTAESNKKQPIPLVYGYIFT